jgi:predicted nucleic acid-binding protein
LAVIEKTTESPILLDAGVWIATYDVDDPNYEPSLELILDEDVVPAALDLTLYEIANGVLKRWGSSDAATELCVSAASRCSENFVSVNAGLIEATVEIALEYGLTSYDAAYVAVARRHDWQLVSTDIKDLVSQGLAITPDAAV